MTILDSQVVVGVDVAKDEIVIYRSDLERTRNVANKRSALKQWLKTLPANSAIALEATNIYHLDTTEIAHEMGHDVYVIDGCRLNKYRDGIGMRAKTDALDAELLARYLSRESDRLRIWSPPPKAYTQLKSLLRRRAQLVRGCVALKQSWKNEPLLKEQFKQLLAAIAQFEKTIQKTLKEIAEDAGMQDQVKRCQAVEGVGLLTATAAATAFLRGKFANSDEYVAFLGMDPRVRQSGQKDQRRRLSKRGDSEFRRLFHNSAMAASRSPIWKPYYESYLARGLKGTQALVILARKLARVMFALMKNQSEYKPNSMLGGSPQT
ncbi:IS110 family transposase [Pseudomonas laurylsulfativorans]|jgi:transposase|uniref:IS110 family transposase n=1 Tax=Pseudomonas laurylsulfativorans TaxID=1943631 RepID=A0A2S3VHA4_9PSED|nr:transposase [Pseudomonas laurylsulfativorans]POF38615.1 IS110 family transposase [Pseudomonas laurylsulfativorans]POF39354.1 IS110 family transposase [Pseudomonas laurylsulfativorans]POF40400.1 IS110 family transposase [Pseudomonas laurylsulfativorans]POF40497.1 IS110 family transposase [Pseudomonas laurylsulfativorans]POF41466.1 IS110 family transposase [Pseudomonas laurylsulfativorans]